MAVDLDTLINSMTSEDEALINFGRALVSKIDSSQLQLGRLALQFAPMGESGVRSGAMARTELYADAIGMELGSLRVLRSVAHAWSVVQIGDDEFPFGLLVALRTVGDKEGLVEALRETYAEKRWAIDEGVRYAAERGFIDRGSAPVERSARRSGLPSAALACFKLALRALAATSAEFIPPRQFDAFSELALECRSALDRIERQVYEREHR